MYIQYNKGDATNPIGDGNKVITHICNDIGGWGRGFVLALSNKWKQPEQTYRSINPKLLTLGLTHIVRVEDNIWVANMVAQRDVITSKNYLPPIRYKAVETCLKQVKKFALANNASIHMPRIGCGLAGGEWSIIESIIKSVFDNTNVRVYVYDL